MQCDDHILRVCEAVQSAVSDIGFDMPWRVRLRAAELLIAALVGAAPEVALVYGVAYGRLALARIGRPLFPRTAAELVQLRSRAGPAMLMLGQDQSHGVLVVDERVVIELVSWHDFRDPGVMLQPFVRRLGEPIEDEFVFDALAGKTGVVYRARSGRSLTPLNRLHEQMARQLAHAAASNVRWRLDAPARTRRRSA